jgi:hypothetical protein
VGDADVVVEPECAGVDVAGRLVRAAGVVLAVVRVSVELGGEATTVNTPKVVLSPVETVAVTAASPWNAANEAEQSPCPPVSFAVHSVLPPPSTVTDLAAHLALPGVTAACTETVVPTCAGLGPPIPPDSTHRVGAAPADGTTTVQTAIAAHAACTGASHLHADTSQIVSRRCELSGLAGLPITFLDQPSAAVES